MPKSKQRRPTQRRPALPQQRQPTHPLQAGVPGPAGWVIRLARPTDVLVSQRLLPLADPSLDAEGVMLAREPGLAANLLRATRHGRQALLDHPPATSAEHPLRQLFIRLSLLLVAVNEHGDVDGVLLALPPIRRLHHSLQADVAPLPAVIAAACTVIKIKGLAVAEPMRGHGVGTALLQQCVQLYADLGWQAFYGHFDAKTTLAKFYTRHGFDIVGRWSAVHLDDLVGFPLRIHAVPSERLFVRRR